MIRLHVRAVAVWRVTAARTAKSKDIDNLGHHVCVSPLIRRLQSRLLVLHIGREQVGVGLQDSAVLSPTLLWRGRPMIKFLAI